MVSSSFTSSPSSSSHRQEPAPEASSTAHSSPTTLSRSTQPQQAQGNIGIYPPVPASVTLARPMYLQTPRRAISAIPQSAPPKQGTMLSSNSRANSLLTSPEATRRSIESLEVIKVARTLKEGFNRIRARLDHQYSPGIPGSSARRYNQQRVVSPLASRAHSATSAISPVGRRYSDVRMGPPRQNDSQQQRALLSPSNSDGSRFSSTQTNFNVNNGPHAIKARPIPLHQAYSCPPKNKVRRFINISQMSLITNESNNVRDRKGKKHEPPLPAPKFALQSKGVNGNTDSEIGDYRETEESRSRGIKRRHDKMSESGYDWLVNENRGRVGSDEGSRENSASPSISLSSVSSAPEVTEAAEAMMLFMNSSEHSSQREDPLSAPDEDADGHNNPVESPTTHSFNKNIPACSHSHVVSHLSETGATTDTDQGSQHSNNSGNNDFNDSLNINGRILNTNNPSHSPHRSNVGRDKRKRISIDNGSYRYPKELPNNSNTSNGDGERQQRSNVFNPSSPSLTNNISNCDTLPLRRGHKKTDR